MNTIVYVSIALLVLVLIVAFTTGGLGNLFGQITETGPTQLDSAKSRCASLCASARTAVSTNGHAEWPNSQYCKEDFGIDVDGDGTVGSNEIRNCWESPISSTCSTTSSTPSGTLTLSTTSGFNGKGECDQGKYEQEVVKLQIG
jgi:hypothetical protein